jgi:hypothetical protein
VVEIHKNKHKIVRKAKLGSSRNIGKYSARELNRKGETLFLLRVRRHKFLPSGNAAMVSEYQGKGMEKFVLARTIILILY